MSLAFSLLFVILARIVDVSMGTLRVSFIARGSKKLAAACGFTEILIWVIVVSRVLTGSPHWTTYIAYALGFTLGTFVGMFFEERLAVGWALVRVISGKPIGDFPQRLSAAGFGATRLDAHGVRGPVQILVTLMPRKRLAAFKRLLSEFDPAAFYTIEDVRHVRDGLPTYATASTAAGKVPMPPI